MLVRRAFKTGRAVCIAIPRKYREALKILPGTNVTITLKDKALTISRAITTPENMIGTPDGEGVTTRG